MPDTPPAVHLPAPASPGRRARGPIGPLLLGLPTLAGFTFCGYSPADAWCNEAVAHLQQCCPEFDASAYTRQPPPFPVGCERYSFDVEEGKRFARAFCQELIDQGDRTAPAPPDLTVEPAP
jgi:hypothetical protein